MKRTWLYLFLLFTVVPAGELFILVKVGQLIGATATVAIILVTGVLGAWLAKREGAAVIRQLGQDLKSGLPPASRVMEGVLVLVGAVLLVTPGILTDITGFSLIIPFSRALIAPVLLRVLLKRFGLATIDLSASGPFQHKPAQEQARAASSEDSPFEHPVV